MGQQSRFWKRFNRNKAALIALGFILMVSLIAIFAYPLSTDDSENANRVIIECATKPPGYKALFLRKRNVDEAEQRNFLQYLAYGKLISEKWIPIQNPKIIDDSIRYEYIIDDDLKEFKTDALALYVPKNVEKGKDILSQITVKKKFRLGTDRYGRDVLSRLLQGTRVSMAVGLIAVLLSISIGVLLGAFGGYFGGWVDQFIVWLINVVWSIPTLLLVFAITFILGKGFWQIFIAVGLTMWVGTARLIRGQVMALKELEYVQAAKTMGFSDMRIILKHILPNVIGPTVVLAATNFATAILIEAGLSFLGIGVQPPTPSWGLMIKENYNFIITNRPLLALVPGVAIMLIVLAFNLLGNGLRDSLDVKEQI